MRRLLVFLAFCAVGTAQIQIINNELMTTARTKLNSNFSYLNTALVGKQALLPSGASSQFLRGSDLTFVSIDTGLVGEGANLYFTNARARAALSVSAAPLAYNSTTGVFSLPAAASGQAGYLTAADWATFNAKAPAAGPVFTGTVDSHGASKTLPNRTGTGSPVARDACATIGETYFQTDASAGSNTFACTVTGTPGTWNLQGGGGSGLPLASVCSIDTYSPAADGSTDDSAVFTTAAASCSLIQLTANKTYAIGTNLTLASSVRFEATSKLLVKTGITLALNGTTIAPPTTIFTMQGTAVVTLGTANSQIYAEWFGAKRDGSTDDLAAINNAIKSLTSGGKLQYLEGTYKITGPILHNKDNVTESGISSTTTTGGTIISNTATTGDTISVIGSATACAAGSVFNPVIQHFSIMRATVATAGNGINLTDVCHGTVTDVISFDSFNQFYLRGTRGRTEIQRSMALYTTSVAAVRVGFYIDNAVDANFTTYIMNDHVASSGGHIRGLYFTGTALSDLVLDHFESAGNDYGLYLDPSDTPPSGTDIHITNGIHDLCITACIYLNTGYAATHDVEITGGYVQCSSTSGAVGISLNNARGVKITGVQFWCNGTSQTGLLLLNALDNTYTANTFNDTVLAIGCTTSHHSAFMGNVIKTAGSPAKMIDFVGCQSNNLVGNILIGTVGTAAIAIDSASANNKVHDNDLTGITGTKVTNASTGTFIDPDQTGAPSVNAGSCTGATIGTGATNESGTITGLPTGACSVVVTFANITATTGWACAVNDQTTANLFRQSAGTTTTATFAGTSVSADVLRYSCRPY